MANAIRSPFGDQRGAYASSASVEVRFQRPVVSWREVEVVATG